MYYHTMNFQVADFENFKKVFNSSENERASSNIRLLNFLRGAEDENRVFLLFEAPSVEAIKERMANPGLHKKWAEAGIIGKPEVNIFSSL